MRTLLPILAAVCAACAAPGPERPVITVDVDKPVPIFIRCTEATPEVPTWALDQAAPDADVDGLMRSALAELEQRAGYEVKLLTALLACKFPPALTPKGLP